LYTGRLVPPQAEVPAQLASPRPLDLPLIIMLDNLYAAYMSDWGPVFVKCGVLYIYSVNFNVQLPLRL